ncbi:MAG TPA: hypothetical protein PKN48_12825 [Bacteroidales bacterium]|nr:hypothetical protein [Bacteroidales bacterium]
MKYIFLLSIITLISVFLAYLIYKKTRSVAIIIGLLLIYYWTFNGAWLFVFDVLSGYEGKNIGFTYYVIERKMFPLFLDNDYLLSVLYYGIFYIILLLTLFLITRKIDFKINNNKLPVRLIPFNLFLISFVSLILSYLCVHHKFQEAIDTKTSLYYMIRHTPNRFATLHQIFNMISVFTAYLTLVVYLSGKNAKYFYLKNKKIFFGILIFVNITIISLYFVLIGNKHDLIFAGLFGFLFYFANNLAVVWKKVVLFIVIIVFPLTLTDFVRGLPLLNYATRMPVDKFDMGGKVPSYLNVLFNNEMFYAHFSMYGTLSKDVELTHGKSFLNLAESFIPRVLVPERSADAYTHYTTSVHAKQGQGYSLHHATGWYINFGIIGTLLAGLIWGLVWGLVIKKNFRISRVKNKFFIILYVLAPTLFVAFIPNLIRNGIEGYKALLLEAFIIPTVIAFVAQMDLITFIKSKTLKK